MIKKKEKGSFFFTTFNDVKKLIESFFLTTFHFFKDESCLQVHKLAATDLDIEQLFVRYSR
ncbi:hypothetical protein BD560DRAFT_385495 [Blakeslea trispora]|nr:hypothetical protein BD560DRAFT_385495 [Blakeslea trispora]